MHTHKHAYTHAYTHKLDKPDKGTALKRSFDASADHIHNYNIVNLCSKSVLFLKIL